MKLESIFTVSSRAAEKSGSDLRPDDAAGNEAVVITASAAIETAIRLIP